MNCFLSSCVSVTGHQVARVGILVQIYLTRGIVFGLSMAEFTRDKSTKRCHLYLSLLVLLNTVWSTQKVMTTFNGLGA